VVQFIFEKVTFYLKVRKVFEGGLYKWQY